MSSHLHQKIICSICNKVIRQCRCMSKDKVVTYEPCKDCVKTMKNAEKMMNEANKAYGRAIDNCSAYNRQGKVRLIQATEHLTNANRSAALDNMATIDSIKRTMKSLSEALVCYGRCLEADVYVKALKKD